MRGAAFLVLLLSLLAGRAAAQAPGERTDNVLGGYLSGTENDHRIPGRAVTHDEEGVPVDPGTAGFQAGAAGFNGGTAGRRAGEAGIPERQSEPPSSRQPVERTAAPSPPPPPAHR